MEKTEKSEKRYGLLGKNISYSFSQGYFTQKFKDLGLRDHSYQNLDIRDIQEFPQLLSETNFKGLNVTIPYKEQVIPFLAELDSVASEIGAVNTIKFTEKGLIGFNTDAFGFQKSLEPLLGPHHTKALVLGTGGASKAIVYVLDQLDISYSYVSRTPQKGWLTYDQLDGKIINAHLLIINCTPLGTYPNIDQRPDIPYQFITEKHLLFDLVYNPAKTTFLQLGEEQSSKISNGLKMLELQAEKAWEIWNTR
ncbi:shikimate dehydrogenase family protein [Flagellimonas allohymeniacidonis]|uniref:Shikimate dehydrogenase n=1 Tax=Flagellimonas allohymeniacidonis TaxID=2517819 RepID=A0A4Q8QHR6_9FLAO|nr:shikimate dehydrogenase [Allomuricauda hymeniacidonis]TAI49337.1 shikimate dehydrogenase [Allomuricauda hymeniacidonis]